MEKFIRDGKVGIVISSGYGTPWSSYAFNEEKEKHMLFDSNLVELVLNMEKAPSHEKADARYAIEQYCISQEYVDLEYPNVPELKVIWIPVGMEFCVREYDGAEYVLYKHKMIVHTA